MVRRLLLSAALTVAGLSIWCATAAAEPSATFTLAQLRQYVWATEAAQYTVDGELPPEYSATTSYVANEVVFWHGSEWLSTSPSQDQEPIENESPPNHYWQIVREETTPMATIAEIDFANLVERHGKALSSHEQLTVGSVTFLQNLDTYLRKKLGRGALRPPLLATAGEALQAVQYVTDEVPTLAEEREGSGELSETEGRELQAVAAELARIALTRVDSEHFSPNWFAEWGYPVLQPLKALVEAAAHAENDKGFEGLVNQHLVSLSVVGVPSVTATLGELETVAKKDEQELTTLVDQRIAAEPELAKDFQRLSQQKDLYAALKLIAPTPRGSSITVSQSDLEKLNGESGYGLGEAGKLFSRIAKVDAHPPRAFERSKWEKEIQMAQRVLTGAQDIQEMIQGVVNASPNISKIFLKLGLISDPASEALDLATAKTTANTFTVLEDTVDGGIELGTKVFDWIDPGMVAQLVFELPGIIQQFISITKEEPDQFEYISKEIRHVEEMLTGLGEAISEGFHEMSRTLAGLGETIEQDTRLLQDITANQAHLANDMQQLQDGLDRLDADLFEIASTQRQENFQVALYTDLGYNVRVPEGQLSVLEFEQAAGLFYTWGFDDPYNAISEDPERNWANPTEAERVASVLETGGASGSSNALDFNLDFLLAVGDALDWISPEAPIAVGNPEVWGAGAGALAQLLTENPEYITSALLNEVGDVKDVGEGLRKSLEDVGHAGRAASYAMGRYEEDFGVGPSSNPSSASFVRDEQEVQNQFLSEQDQPGFLAPLKEDEKQEAACGICALGEAPSGNGGNIGQPYIDVWGTEQEKGIGPKGLGNEVINEWPAEPEQAPNAKLTELETRSTGIGFNEDNEHARTKDNVLDYLDPCDKDYESSLEAAAAAVPITPKTMPNLARPPLPNVYANAWHLGLGKLTACYGGALSGPPYGEYFGGSYSYANAYVVWMWESNVTLKRQPVLVVDVPVELSGSECERGNTVADLKALWKGNSYNSGHCEIEAYQGQRYSNLAEVLDEGAGDAAALTTESHSLVGPNGYLYRLAKADEDAEVAEWSPTSQIDPPSNEEFGVKGGLVAEVTAELERLREGMAGAVAPETGESGSGELSEEFGLREVSRELAGARALANDLAATGLPISLESEPILGAFVIGPYQLPANAAPEHELFKYYREIADGARDPSVSPTAPSGELVEEASTRVSAFDSRVSLDARCANEALPGYCEGPSGGAAQVAPVVGATLARLDLTEVAFKERAAAPSGPELLSSPEIVGSPQIGSELVCTEGRWRSGSNPVFTFRWLREGAEVGQGQSYIVQRADGGHSLTCAVTARTSDGETEASSTPVSVSPPSPAPIATTEAASEVGQRVATLRGAVDPNGLPVTKCVFEYGATTAYGQEAACQPSPGSGSSEVAVSAAVKGLTPGLRYHFRVYAKNHSGATDYHSEGKDETFITLAALAPTTAVEEAQSVGKHGATLRGTVDPNGEAVTKCQFVYEAVGSFEKSKVPCGGTLPSGGNSPVAVSAVVDGLKSATLYVYTLEATNVVGTGESVEEQQFTTLVSFPPFAETTAATEVGKKAATLNGIVNPNGSLTICQFAYVPASGGQSKTVSCKQQPGAGDAPVAVTAVLKGLVPGTRYAFWLQAENNEGLVAEFSEVMDFTTAASGEVQLENELTGKQLTVGAPVELLGLGTGTGIIVTTSDFTERVLCPRGGLHGSLVRVGKVIEAVLESGEFEGEPAGACSTGVGAPGLEVRVDLPWRLVMRAGASKKVLWELGNAEDEPTSLELAETPPDEGVCTYQMPDERAIEGEAPAGVFGLNFTETLEYVPGRVTEAPCPRGSATLEGALPLKNEGVFVTAKIVK